MVKETNNKDRNALSLSMLSVHLTNNRNCETAFQLQVVGTKGLYKRVEKESAIMKGRRGSVNLHRRSLVPHGP